MHPINLALWALFVEQAKTDVGKAIEKALGVEEEPNVDHIVADAYAAAVKEREKHLGTSLDEKVDKLALICRAMWEFIRDKYDLSDEVLLSKVTEIDLSDGSLDGKVSIAPKACSKCGRSVSKRHNRCIYCGAEGLVDTPFDAL